MLKSDHTHHHLITLYGDNEAKALNSLISSIVPDKDTHLLTPQDEDGLMQAAENSSLIIIGSKNENDENLHLAKTLKYNRMVVADIISIVFTQDSPDIFKVMAKGFDLSLCVRQCERKGFKEVLKHRLTHGAKRLASVIQEEEYRRFSDALSCAPTSVIVFDQEKRVVFVSEHYFRAYPKSAPRLIRGLSVFDAFDMLSKEEELSEDDPRYTKTRDFWYNLNGDIEFELDNGVSYRMKAVPLPNQRGTIVTAQNITEYVRENRELKRALGRLK